MVPRAGVPEVFGFNSLLNFWTRRRSTQSFIFSKKCPAGFVVADRHNLYQFDNNL